MRTEQLNFFFRWKNPGLPTFKIVCKCGRSEDKPISNCEKCELKAINYNDAAIDKDWAYKQIICTNAKHMLDKEFKLVVMFD